jgi:predicted phosphodiesterase
LILEFDGFQIVHGSLVNPVEEYLDSLPVSVPTFNLMIKPKLFVGHTHIPLRFRYDDKEIINPGSVGQPRDGNPDAAYIIYENEKDELNLYRVKYEVERVQGKMKSFNLPKNLIERLTFGR